MADYGYRSTVNGKSRLGPKFQAWETTTEEGCTPQSVITKTEVRRDHVCRPVIVDPDGTTRPAVVILPQKYKTAGLVSKVEVEECVIPSTTIYATDYAYKEEECGHYGHFENPSSKINSFIKNVQTAVNGSGETDLVQYRPYNHHHDHDDSYDSGSKGWNKPSIGNAHDSGTSPWGKPSGGIHNNGNSPWGRPSGGNHGPWSKPSYGTNDTYGNRWGKPTDDTDDYGATGWGKPSSKTSNYPTSVWGKPSGPPVHVYEESYNKYEPSIDSYHTPTKTTTDAWGRPNRAGWASPPAYEGSITKPTSNIDAAADYLRESTKPSSVATAPWKSRFSPSSPQYTTKETTIETIDNKEASRRYGSGTVSPTATTISSGPTIDSKEAARKYKGSII